MNIKEWILKIGECNTNKKWKVLIVFDDMIANMHSNKKLIL